MLAFLLMGTHTVLVLTANLADKDLALLEQLPPETNLAVGTSARNVSRADCSPPFALRVMPSARNGTIAPVSSSTRSQAGQPGIKRRRVLRHYTEPHPGVLRAAKLGTRSLIIARLVGLNPNEIASAWDRVDLASQSRSPEIVDHVGGFDRDQRFAANGNVDFIGGDGSV